MLSTEGPKLAVGDVNGDGLEDFYSQCILQIRLLFLQQPNGHFKQVPRRPLKKTDTLKVLVQSLLTKTATGTWTWWFSSGRKPGFPPDLANLLTRLYINDGKGNFSRSVKGWPDVMVNASCVKAGDFDGDGLTDLFIGARVIPGHYGLKPASVLLKNEGKGVFKDVTKDMAPQLLDLGMVTDAWLISMQTEMPN